MKLSIIIVLGFLAIAFSIGIFGVVLITQSQEAMQSSIAENSIILAQETLAKLDYNIDARVLQARAYALDLASEDVLIKSNEDFGKIKDVEKLILEIDKNWTSAKVTTPFMEDMIGNSLSQEVREEFELKEFYTEHYGFPVYAEAFATNKYGANAAQTQKTSDYYQADEKWWIEAKEKGVHISEIEFDESAVVYSIDISVRIEDANGSFMGVFKAVVNIEDNLALLRKLKSRELEAVGEDQSSRDFEWLDKTGKIIYSSEGGQTFEQIGDDFFKNVNENKDNFFISSGDENESDELIAFAVSRPHEDHKDLGWVLLIETETVDAFAPIVELRNTFIILIIGLSGIAVLMGILISRLISKPISNLTASVNDISTGHLNNQIERSSIDEINSLSEALDRILTTMKRAIKRMDTPKEDAKTTEVKKG